MKRPVGSAFLDGVDKSGGDDACWNWKYSITTGGYGQFSIGGHPNYCHRYAYRLEYGEIPDGLSVLHKCDNRKCCNPKHLFLGTQKDNLEDMRRKGRGGHLPRWKKMGSPAGKVKEDDVKRIREEFDGIGTMILDASKKYGISAHAILSIIIMESWIPKP